MRTYFVTYKLDNSPEEYPKISDKLKSYPNWIKLFSRTWIINTNVSTRKVRDELVEAIEGKGKVLVINITGSSWATNRIGSKYTEWMRENV